MYSTTEHSVCINTILCVYLCIPYDCMYRFKCSLRATRQKEATGMVRDGRENMTHFLAKGNGSNTRTLIYNHTGCRLQAAVVAPFGQK